MALTKPRAYQIYDIDYKQATRAVTVANVTLTGGAPALVDGVNLVAKDRVLVTGQSDAKQNGIYVVSVVGSGSDGTWVRSDDTNSSGELLAGTIVMVTEGNTYADTQWKLTTDDPIIIGTSELVFVQNYSANSISAGSSNVSVTANANVTISSAGTANVLTVANTGAYVTGDLSATGNIVGGNITTTGASGNISGANYITANVFSATGNITGSYIIGNGSQLTGLPAGYSNADVANYLASGTDANNIVTTGNVQGTYILGNGSLLTGVSTSSSNINNGNSNVTVTSSGGNVTVGIGGTSNVAVFATTGVYIDGEISATGNIDAGGVRNLTSTTPPASPSVGDTWYDLSTDTMFRYVYDGTNYFWQDISGGSIIATPLDLSYGNANVAAYGESGWAGNIIPSANATYSLGNVNNQWKSLYVSNTTIYIGNVPLSTDGNTLSVAGNPVVVATSGDNISLTGNLSAQGNITGSYIIGNGSQLTGLPAGYANSNAASYFASGNNTSNIVTTGNIQGSYVIGNGSQLTGLPAGYANSNAAAFFASGTVATDIKTTALISATGNITGNYIIGNGSQLTGLPAGYSNADVSTYLASGTVTSNILTTGDISATGNIVGGNITTTGTSGNISGANYITANVFSASGNVTGGNIATAGQVSAVGAGYFGAGLYITGNISATGNIDYTNVNDLVVGDPLIYMGANNTADLVDLGFVASANVATVYQHLGLARNHSTGVWGLFGNVVAEPTTVIDWANAVYQPLLAGSISSTGNITAAGFLSAVGNITGASLAISSTGNVTAGNVSAVGNVTGNYILGNGALLTGVITSVANINNGTSNVTVVGSGGNITAGVAGTANALVITATGTSAVGNISAPQVIATNGLLVNSNVIAGTFTLPANTNAISVGPILNAVGSNVTVPPGQRWIII